MRRLRSAGRSTVVAGAVAFAVFAASFLFPDSSRASVPPGSPVAVTAVAFDRGVRIRWSVPTGVTDVDGFQVNQVGASAQRSVPANRREVMFGPLPNGVAVSFTVTAHGPVGWGTPSAATVPVTPTRPNIVLVVTDDARADAVDEMPWLRARRWRRFVNAFVPEPQCCPSRASLLTGRLPVNTGVDTLELGSALDDRRTLATMLRAVGYRTALAGKYLNGAPFAGRAYPPPGWTDFARASGYFRYPLAIDRLGSVWKGSAAADYSTDVLRRYLVGIIEGSAAAQPLFLYFAPTAPHRQENGGDPVPAPRHVGSCASRSYPVPASLNARDRISAPSWFAVEPLRNPDLMLRWRRAACESLRAVDEALASITAALARAGRMENTYFVFTSDNGFHFGEHRLVEKGDLYEEAIRVPLVVGGPSVAVGTDARLTSNIDVAPTVLEWARVAPPPGFFDGASFGASARGESTIGPEAVLLVGCRSAPRGRGGSGVCGGYPAEMPRAIGVRTARYKYIEYADGYRQLFDLASDPAELDNVAFRPDRQALRESLAALLGPLRGS